MGTRGFVGFVVDGTEKITYNHWDSYPGGLGAVTLDWLRSADHAAAREAAKQLRMVDSSTPPTAEDIERLGAYADTEVGSRDTVDWYVLLRLTQGRPDLILESGYAEDSSGFPADSLFAEWGYIVDFDAGTFEVYAGFQTSPHNKGRFASKTPNREGYYPVALVASWPLTSLPESMPDFDDDES